MEKAEEKKNEPEIITKSLFWTKIDAAEETVWTKLGSYPHMDSAIKSSFLTRFSRQVEKKELSEKERIGQEVGAIGGVLKKGSLTFMDQKRFNNIALKLSQLRCSNARIRDAVLELDLAFLTAERAEQLLACAPTGDDLESIAPYDGDPDLLAQCERFFYDVQHVPYFRQRLEAICCVHRFQPNCKDIARSLGSVALASATLLSSRSFQRFIALVREAGNLLNASSAAAATRSNAEAFDFDILPRLAHVKSVDGRSDLLRWLALYLHNPEAEGEENANAKLIRDLSPCRDASRVDFQSLEAAIASLRRAADTIIRCTNAVEKFWQRKPSSTGLRHYDNDLFAKRMASISASTESSLNAVKRQLVETKFLFQASMSSWGLKKATSPRPVFLVLSRFAFDLASADAKNIRVHEMAVRSKKIAEKKKEDQAMRARLRKERKERQRRQKQRRQREAVVSQGGKELNAERPDEPISELLAMFAKRAIKG